MTFIHYDMYKLFFFMQWAIKKVHKVQEFSVFLIEHCHEDVCDSGHTASYSVNVSTRGEWVENLMPQINEPQVATG